MVFQWKSPKPSFNQSIQVIDWFSLHWYPQPLFATKPQPPRHPTLTIYVLSYSCRHPLAVTPSLFLFFVGCWFLHLFSVSLLFVTSVVIPHALNFKVSRSNKIVILDRSMAKVLDYHIHLNHPMLRLLYMLNRESIDQFKMMSYGKFYHFNTSLQLWFENLK